jgi:hypothetical protein
MSENAAGPHHLASGMLSRKNYFLAEPVWHEWTIKGKSEPLQPFPEPACKLVGRMTFSAG